jgi:hypothetical protein
MAIPTIFFPPNMASLGVNFSKKHLLYKLSARVFFLGHEILPLGDQKEG